MKRYSWRSFPKRHEAVILARGGEAVPVGRPDFKPGWGCQAVPGRFDPCSLPPATLACRSVAVVPTTVAQKQQMSENRYMPLATASFDC